MKGVLSSSGPCPGPRSGPGQVSGQVRSRRSKVKGQRTKTKVVSKKKKMGCPPYSSRTLSKTLSNSLSGSDW